MDVGDDKQNVRAPVRVGLAFSLSYYLNSFNPCRGFYGAATGCKRHVKIGIGKVSIPIGFSMALQPVTARLIFCKNECFNPYRVFYGAATWGSDPFPI